MPSVAVITNVDRAGAEGLRSRLGRARWLEVESFGEITGAARDAVAEGASTVVAVGGDGTQRAAAAGMTGTGAALVPVPGGTINLLARLLGIEDVDAAVAAAERGARRHLDVGVADGEVFLLNASTGADATAIARTSRWAKEHLGPLAFVVNGLRSLARPPHHVRVVADGRTIHDGWATTVLVLTNGRRGGPHLRLEPGAEADDGLLHVQVVRARGLGDLARLVRGALRRRPDDRVVTRARCREVTVTSARDFAVQLDGDPGPARRRFSCRVEPGALCVAVPPGAEVPLDEAAPEDASAG